MTEKISILCPTRRRGQKAKECYESFLQTTAGVSDFYFIIDEDDVNSYDFLDYPNANFITVPTTENKPTGLVYPLNYGYKKLKQKYAGYMFVGDDSAFRTPRWDKIFLDKIIKENYNCILYGNDLLRRHALPVSFIGGKNVFKEYMIYPEFYHVFCDTYIKKLGIKNNSLFYYPNIIIEHMHYTTGKSDLDETYRNTVGSNYWNHDKKIFENI